MDTKNSEITDFFGTSLRKVNGELLHESTLSKEVIDFLTKVGLPSNDTLLINFDYKMKRINNGKFVVIGDDNETKICIEKCTDRIYSIDDKGELPARFVNSDIRALLKFLMIYTRLTKAKDEEAGEILNEIRDEFMKADAAALSDDENWWSIILGELQ